MSAETRPTLQDIDEAFAELRVVQLTSHVCTCEPPCVLETYDPGTQSESDSP